MVSFTFSTSIASGGTYAVTVLTQPSNPSQTCVVAAGTGTATANVTGITIDLHHESGHRHHRRHGFRSRR